MIVQMTNEAIIPIGRSRCGFFTSSAEVANASNPKKAKNTAAPHEKPPLKPYGENGIQFSGLN